MLRLDDVVHLPQIDAVVAQFVAGGPGLTVVAGLDPRGTITGAAGGSSLFDMDARPLPG